MQTRSDYIKQLAEVDSTIRGFADKVAGDIRTLSEGIAGRADAADEVLAGAKSERRMRSAIEESCLDIMLLQQPLVADDLRFVTGAFRLVSDISHIDEMARDASYLVRGLPVEVTARISEQMTFGAGKVADMLLDAVRAFRESDEALARSVFAMDDDVDDVYLAAEGVVIDLIKSSETRARYLPELLMIAKYFERMADDAVRIADWAVFRVTGVHEVQKDAPSSKKEAASKVSE